MPMNDDKNLFPPTVLLGGPCHGRRIEANRNSDRIGVHHTKDGKTYGVEIYKRMVINFDPQGYRHIFMWVHEHTPFEEAMMRLCEYVPEEEPVRISYERI